jgi:DeoR/GlpR family transcriptional regulator of sugar metabolism
MIQQSLSPFARQDAILHYVERQQRVSITQVCDQFTISLATARRDLETLAREGKIERVHGGAVALRKAPPEPPLSLRSAVQADEKRRIGACAARLINNGETVFLGSGTTVVEIAHQLHDKTGLTVITNSLLVINALAGAKGVTVLGLGGELRPSEMSFIGHLTEQALREFRLDKVFIGVRALDIHEGLTNDYLPEAQTDRSIVRAARQAILVADHTKCGRIAPIFLAPLRAIHTFITDSHTPPEFLDALKQAGILTLTS